MFEKSLHDMVKGMRAHPRDEASYIGACVSEIKEEVKSKSAFVKQQAVSKLVYLQMLGHDVSWASFHFIDVMALPHFRSKVVGTLATGQTFHDGTEVALLTTNLHRKAIASSNQYEVSLALGCLAKVPTPELARDLLSDVVNMLGSSRPLIRKKAVACAYKLLTRCSDALPQLFPRLQKCLDDSHPGVVSCTVNVLAELIAQNPKGYLGLAPALYGLLTTSSCNWTLIKVTKCMRRLVPHEPRLGRKLVGPLTHLIETTGAKSLQFECLVTVAATMSCHAELAGLAVSRLREFVVHDDPNLKCLGMQALAALQSVDKALVTSCHDDILASLDDADPAVRSQALSLVSRMTTRANLAGLVTRLMAHVTSPAEISCADEVVAVVLSACRTDGFAHVPSFKWLVSVLLALGEQPSAHSDAVADLLMEVVLRVPSVRAHATSAVFSALSAISAREFADAPPPATMCALAWVVAEHGSLLPLQSRLTALRCLVSPSTASLPPRVRASFVQAALRVLVMLPLTYQVRKAADDDLDGSPAVVIADLGEEEEQIALRPLLAEMIGAVTPMCAAADFEVRERALTTYSVLSLLEQAGGEHAASLLASLRSALSAEIRTIAPNAQRKVRAPRGLERRIHEPISLDDDDDDATDRIGDGRGDEIGSAASEVGGTPADGGRARLKRAPVDSPFYLPASVTSANSAPNTPKSACAAAPTEATEAPLDAAESKDAAAAAAAAAASASASASAAADSGKSDGCAVATSPLGLPMPFVDDDEMGVAVVNLDEDEPDDGDDAEVVSLRPDDKPRRRKKRREHAPRGEGGAPLLVEMLGESEEGGEAAKSKHGRRKHKSRKAAETGIMGAC